MIIRAILTGFRMHNSIFKNKSCNLPLAAICDIRNYNMRLNWMMFAALFGLITRKRVTFYDGDDDLSSGLRLHRTGGHSAGLQFVSVHTKRGWVVLASDASHYYEHMQDYRPFTIAFHVGEMMESFDRLKKVAPSPDHIIPGHDPKVMERYPAVAGKEGLMVRLDEMPKP